MDQDRMARQSASLLQNEVLGEVIAEAHDELVEYAIHGATPEIREDARCRLLGLREIVNRLKYYASGVQPEEDADIPTS